MNDFTHIEPRTPRGAAAPGPAVFHSMDYCRERAVATLARAVRQSLQGLGTSAGDGVSGAAFAFARRAEREIDAAFRRALASRFSAAATGGNQIDWRFGERLLADPSLLQNVVTRELAVEANLAAHDNYLSFDAQMRILLQDPAWDAISNPLAPSIIAAALVEAAQVTGAPPVIAFTLTAYAMHGMAGAINLLYGELAHYLADKTGQPVSPGAREVHLDDTMAIEVWEPEGGPEIMTLLQHMAPETAAAEVRPTLDVQAWLTELQRVEANAINAEMRGGALDLTPPDRTLLRALKETPAAAGLQRHERVVLDIVSRLFEYMLNGSGVPLGVKQVLSRLQIPVFKAALLDPDFFGRETHSARQFINEIAGASVGWDEGSMLYAHMLRKVTLLAHEILHRFDRDVTAFACALDSFRAFLSEQQRHPDRAAEALMTWLQREEQDQARQDEARRAAEAAITGRVIDPEVPDSVRLFLCREWVKPLQAAYLQAGDTGAAWQEAVSIMDDLIWSVRPKFSHESRYYLVKTLPALLRRLQQEMMRADIAQEARDEFMSRLVICHAQAVKSGYQADEAQPVLEEAWKAVALARAAQPSATAVVLPFAPAAGVQGDTAVALRFVDPRAVTAAPVEETLAIHELQAIDESVSAANLTPGAWVAFQYGRGDSYLARLKWVSPVKRTYLFVDREGRRVATMAEAQLEIALRGGAARIVEQTPLVDRAMQHVMEELKHAAAA